MHEQLVLYTFAPSPFCQRVEIALAEANAEFLRYEIDAFNMPDWYKTQVNPAGKVPAMTYGGPKVPPDQPSPESVKLAESLVLLYLVSDLYPDLVPGDAVQRAKMRLFIDALSTKLWPAYCAFIKGQTVNGEELLESLQAIQSLLPDEGFAVGKWSLADVAIAPILARVEVALRCELSLLTAAEVQETFNEFRSPRFVRLRKYLDGLKARPSFEATWNEDGVVQIQRKFFAWISQH